MNKSLFVDDFSVTCASTSMITNADLFKIEKLAGVNGAHLN